MPFTKAHGLGNDFILVDKRHCPPEASGWARRLCGRHLGIGGDGVIVYRLMLETGAMGMRLINADGTDAEISGNGVRCLAALGVAKGWMEPAHVIETVAGPRSVEVTALGPSRFRVATDLGVPVLDSRAIPTTLDPPAARVVDHRLDVTGRPVDLTATSLGNPHCAVFLDEVAGDALIASLGPALETHPFFPRKTNVEFVTVRGRDALRVRFWERGVGPTRSSGTGAASAAVAAMLRGVSDRRVRVECDGGTFDVEWPEGGSVRQTGEVELVFEGDWLG